MQHSGPNAASNARTEQIHDNAKRSVSIRINTSDYGRIRIAAQRLRVREAEVFRYLVKVGLAGLRPFLSGGDDREAVISALAEVGPDLAAHFGLDALQLRTLLPEGANASLVAVEDLELIVLVGPHPRTVQARLKDLLRREIDLPGIRAELRDYLQRKYLAP